MSDVANSALQALNRFVEQEQKRLGIAPLPVPRDFVPCQWCHGAGCVSCFAKREQRKKELDEEYRRQFPNGPQPIFTARRDNPEEMEQLKSIFHADKLREAFGPGGGGMEEIERKCEAAMKSRETKQEKGE